MHETINFLSIIDSKVKKNRSNSTKIYSSVRQKLNQKRTSKFPYAKAIQFNENKYNGFPKWLTEKEGFINFMYSNYESKLMSIPKICQKLVRASDEKYFVSLLLEQIPIFQNLPNIVNQIILNKLESKYYKAGEYIHNQDNNPQFLGLIFIGSVQYKTAKGTIVKQKNDIILTDAFSGAKHPTIISRQETIILAITQETYKFILLKLKQQMETKERDEISDFMKSTFFSELHIKDKRAIAFYNDLEVKFYFKDQIIEEAGRDVNYFYLIYKGQVNEENHIYIRQHNKWPLPDRKWEVRAVYNSFHKNNVMKAYSFFGDEQIISNSKFKSKYISKAWTIILAMPAEKFISNLSAEDVKRLKKYRTQHVDINYGQFQKNIRARLRAETDRKKIAIKAINTSLSHITDSSPRKMTLVTNFQKSMIHKSFFTDPLPRQ